MRLVGDSSCLPDTGVQAPILALILTTALPMSKLDLVWRLLLAFGALPPILLLYHRTKMTETAHFTAVKASQDAAAAAAAAQGGLGATGPQLRVSKMQLALTEFKARAAEVLTYWKLLFGTAGTWFLVCAPLVFARTRLL